MLISLIAGACLLSVGIIFARGFRDYFHPAAVFSIMWGGVIIAISIGENFGYLQISEETLLIFVLGIFSFVAGALSHNGKQRHLVAVKPADFNYGRMFWFCVILHVTMLPIAWSEVTRIGGGAEDIYATAYRLRAGTVTGDESVGFLVGNYLTAGLFFIPVLLIGMVQKKIKAWRCIALAIPWMTLNILVGGRSALIILVLALVYVYFSLGKKLSTKVVGIFFTFFFVILIAGNLLVGKIDASVSDGAWAVLQQSGVAFFDYLLQGPILFSQYVEHPAAITPTWDALIFPCHMLSKVDLCKVPPLHQEFMAFRRDGADGNVYSVFFSIFPKYGFVGLLVVTWLYGYWTKFHHDRRHRSTFDRLIAGFLFSACILSVYSDVFGPSIYFFIKIFFFNWCASYAFRQTKDSGVNPRP